MTREGKDWWKAITDLEEMINAWADAYHVIQQIEERPEVLHLHYEELVFDFYGSIARLNTFLGIDLEYENILVSDPNKHYDRSYLSPEMKAPNFSHLDVRAYIEKNKDKPVVSAALEHEARLIELG